MPFNFCYKCCCFWDTEPFKTEPVYIAKHLSPSTNKYNVYGCFCCPECAVAYLFNETCDSSIKWERYSLLNHLYSPIYNYENNINRQL